MTKLFDFEPINILPFDGEAVYFGQIFEYKKIQNYLTKLMENIQWANDEVFLFGKKIITARKVAWYGENNLEYVYSNAKKIALPFTPILLEIKAKIEEITNETYNSCLLNLYHNGSESMGWHADNETTIEKNSSIASISFGAERKFCFKHKSKNERIEMVLENGSLLLMKGQTQSHWLHALPASKKILTPRINLTFRKMVIQ